VTLDVRDRHTAPALGAADQRSGHELHCGTLVGEARSPWCSEAPPRSSARSDWWCGIACGEVPARRRWTSKPSISAGFAQTCDSPPPGLPGFSSLPAATVLRRSLPLYGRKVTRRDRAVASGRQAGRQRSSDRGIASEPDGWRRICCHRRGSGLRLGPAASGTARGVTAPGHLRRGALGDAGRSPERQDASGEGHQARRDDLAEARRSQRTV
jgi:hypothetical protein